MSQALEYWAYQRGLQLDFIRPGKPVANAFIESFNGLLRDECLMSTSSPRSTTRRPRSKRGAWTTIAPTAQLARAPGTEPLRRQTSGTARRRSRLLLAPTVSKRDERHTAGQSPWEVSA
jgi:transposase InsO family protein